MARGSSHGRADVTLRRSHACEPSSQSRRPSLSLGVDTEPHARARLELISRGVGPPALSWLAATAFFAVAFLTQTGQSLDYDELFTLWVSSRPWGELIRQANLDGFTPPLFYGLVKVLSLLGIGLESLRVLSAALSALAVVLALQASERLFGSKARLVALLVIPCSAYLFTFAHELRPYSAILACGVFFWGRLGGPAGAKSGFEAAIAALIATAFSYLGLFMLVVWQVECRTRQPGRQRLAVGLIGAFLCAPGLAKAHALTRAGVIGDAQWGGGPFPLGEFVFGLAPLPFGLGRGAAGLIVLVAVITAVVRRKESASLPLLLRSLSIVLLLQVTLDAVVRIGFAPRYFAVAMSVLLLLLTGVLSRLGPLGLVLSGVICLANVQAVSRYLADASAREDWRGVMAQLDRRLGKDGLLLAFPFHHAAVAAHAYAPTLKVGGGYSSREAPVFWYDPPAAFSGYSFRDLRRLEDLGPVLRPLAAAADLCVLSDEPDVTKTARAFAALEVLGGTEPLNLGSSRMRVLCRRKGPGV